MTRETITLIFIAQMAICGSCLFYASVLLKKEVDSTPNAPWYIHFGLRSAAMFNYGRGLSLWLSMMHGRAVYMDMGGVSNACSYMLLFAAGLAWVITSRMPGPNWRKVEKIRRRFADLAHHGPHGRALAILSATGCFVAGPNDRPQDVRRPENPL